MTNTAKGRFCGSCQKTVHDFTQSSDTAIAKVLASETNVCGRFLASQLDRELVVAKEKAAFWQSAIASVFTLAALFPETLQAQEKQRTDQTDARKKVYKMGETAAVTMGAVLGTVLDASGLPIPSVIVTNLQTSQTATSDFDGNFKIPASVNDSIKVDFIGCIPLKHQVSPEDFSQRQTLRLANDVQILEGVVVTGGLHYEKPSLVKRMFRSIGNWFR